ncbi:ABC transporter ATP-binding protein [Dermabacteraceae bacterium P13136]
MAETTHRDGRAASASEPGLHARAVRVSYDRREVLHGVDLGITPGTFTAIIGPNACGKSTLLRSMARVLPLADGHITLDGDAIHRLPSRKLALRLGLLPQSATAPDGITVADLVSRGRSPHTGPLRQWSNDDEAAVSAALRATGVTELAQARVDELSGGQRQRVWIALLLAQQTEYMLLDEPTTYLDVSHQFEVLRLLQGFKRDGKTVVTVLHDLNQAARFADRLVAMKDGRVVSQGAPEEVLTADLVTEVFGLPCLVVPDPVTGTPMMVAR